MGLFGSMFGRRKGLMGNGIVEGDNPAQDDWMRRLFDTQGQAQTMQRESGGGFLGPNFASNMSTLGDGLASAGAYMDGNWEGGAAISDRQAQTRASIAQQAAKQAEQTRTMQALKAQGKTDEQATLIMNGVAGYGDFQEKAPNLPSTVQEAEWYRSATPEQRQAYDQVRPIITQGAGSTVVPRGSWAQGSNEDAIPTQEDGHQYTPGPGGRANSANWKPIGGASGSPVGGGFQYRR